MKTLNAPIRVNVFRNSALSCDCSNNGLTNRYNSLWLFVDMDDNAILDYCAKHDIVAESVLVLERRILWGEKHYFAKPFVEPFGCNRMFGGNYICGDSTFSEYVSSQPIAVHDRFEEWC